MQKLGCAVQWINPYLCHVERETLSVRKSLPSILVCARSGLLCSVDLPQVDSHNFFSGCLKICMNVFKRTSAEGAWNKNKRSAEGFREP